MDRFWNLLINPPLPPATNMAVDWWLLKHLENPLLRFYRWENPAVSLGYRQQTNPPEAVTELVKELQLIVRPSGGGFLYHSGDLSYSLLMPSDTTIATLGIKDSYTRLVEPFVNAVDELGLIRERGWGEDDYDSPNCLEAPGEHEPTSRGAKWLASAQARCKRNLLQQGSLFWKNDWPDELDHSRPLFLKPSADALDWQDLVDSITDQVKSSLFDGRPPEEFELSSSAWDAIETLKPNFQVQALDELPTFRRYGSTATRTID